MRQLWTVTIWEVCRGTRDVWLVLSIDLTKPHRVTSHQPVSSHRCKFLIPSIKTSYTILNLLKMFISQCCYTYILLFGFFCCLSAWLHPRMGSVRAELAILPSEELWINIYDSSQQNSSKHHSLSYFLRFG